MSKMTNAANVMSFKEVYVFMIENQLMFQGYWPTSQNGSVG